MSVSATKPIEIEIANSDRIHSTVTYLICYATENLL